VNGGNDGVVVPALGDRGGRLGVRRQGTAGPGLRVLSSDSGHSDRSGPQAARAGGRAAFGLDPQARRDYGYAADMTLRGAKTIIASYYGRRPILLHGRLLERRTSRDGGSRACGNYDGFLVGNPGLNLRVRDPACLGRRALAKIDPDIAGRARGRALISRIIEACDAGRARDDLTSI
jgi:feruloyl esterase